MDSMIDSLAPAGTRRDEACVLHVGCGAYSRTKLPPVFQDPVWHEIRLDIDPGVRPDIVASITDMAAVDDAAVDAVYSSHNIEHLYAHEVPVALREMRRVLKPGGFLFVTLPDLQEVARRVAEDRLDDPLYLSPMGPIAPLDIFYGHRPSLAAGNTFMAHRTGFTRGTLARALTEAGFAAVLVQRALSAFGLAAVAFRNRPGDTQLADAQARMLPEGDGPVILFAAPAAADGKLAEAIGHHKAGNAGEAEELYRAVLAATPDNAMASYNLGLLCFSQGRLQEAVDAYRDAIAARSDCVEAHINLGTALLALGRPEEAVVWFKRAIALRPDDAMAISNLGKALQDMGRTDDAMAAYRAALGHQPDNAAATLNLGSALLDRQDWDEAASVTRRAIALQPDNAMAHANLGTALARLGQYEEALAACRQAIALRPADRTVLASLGGAMADLGALREAEDVCREAIAADQALPAAHFNLSHALKAVNRLEDAEHAARQALALRPDSPEYHFHLAHLLLLQGELEAGWAEYDWRWKLPDFAWMTAVHGPFAQPCWRGEDIAGKTILIHTEQGLGDIILFARYLPLVVAKAGRVIVAACPAMHRLLRTIDGIAVVSIEEVPLPAFDVYCPLLSLPRAFATRLGTVPADVPYLRAEPAARARWRQRFSSETMRAGIVWAGNPATKGDRFRSPGFASVEPLFSVPGVDFIVLQVGPGRAGCDGRAWPPHARDFGGEVADMADTAAVMANLDLVISSCTASLHLAGALGVRTWAMIPFAPYFPWLLESETTSWYPTMRLYRQAQPGQDWSGVVDRIAGDLAALAGSWPGNGRQ
nr:tetratricopeptide repeat protein [uncultured Rhodopila sp.]